MTCIICYAPLKTGLSGWHRTCPGCAYEGAAHASKHVVAEDDLPEASQNALRQENCRTIVALTRQFAAPRANTLLDVGSAQGWFLEAASRAFEVLGVEPDEVLAKQAAARGLPVRIGYFPQALADGEQFDIIVLNEIIEHIPDIRAALRDCHQRLAPDGTLVLNLPSSHGLCYRMAKLFARLGLRGAFNRLWQRGMPSPHVHYFNPANLTRLVEREGFTLRHSTELAVVKKEGMWRWMTVFGGVHPFKAPLRYLGMRWVLLPLMRLFPSDIMVCIYRKR
jgi:2-polyprenyl-3-methyl-5-hydroxy-6-metoxy-1,4-benzoquinol methylase